MSHPTFLLPHGTHDLGALGRDGFVTFCVEDIVTIDLEATKSANCSITLFAACSRKRLRRSGPMASLSRCPGPDGLAKSPHFQKGRKRTFRDTLVGATLAFKERESHAVWRCHRVARFTPAPVERLHRLGCLEPLQSTRAATSMPKTILAEFDHYFPYCHLQTDTESIRAESVDSKVYLEAYQLQD